MTGMVTKMGLLGRESEVGQSCKQMPRELLAQTNLKRTQSTQISGLDSQWQLLRTSKRIPSKKSGANLGSKPTRCKCSSQQAAHVRVRSMIKQEFQRRRAREVDHKSSTQKVQRAKKTTALTFILQVKAVPAQLLPLLFPRVSRAWLKQAGMKLLMKRNRSGRAP